MFENNIFLTFSFSLLSLSLSLLIFLASASLRHLECPESGQGWGPAHHLLRQRQHGFAEGVAESSGPTYCDVTTQRLVLRGLSFWLLAGCIISGWSLLKHVTASTASVTKGRSLAHLGFCKFHPAFLATSVISFQWTDDQLWLHLELTPLSSVGFLFKRLRHPSSAGTWGAGRTWRSPAGLSTWGGRGGGRPSVNDHFPLLWSP